MQNEYLIIDGYNIINAWTDIFDIKRDSLEDCRDKLLQIFSNYQGHSDSIICVVFDAHMVKGSKLKEERYDNILVIYTSENETADQYIERFVYKMSSDVTIRVATSDYLEQRIVLSSGGTRVSARELKQEVANEIKLNIEKTEIKIKKTERNTLASQLDNDIIDKLEKIRRNIK